MSTFFIATTNVKHNGELLQKGAIVSGEYGTFGELTSDGTLREIVGASSFEEAEEILAKEVVNQNDTEAEIEVAPRDTWGPSPEPEPDPELEPTDAGDTAPTDTNDDAGDKKEDDIAPAPETENKGILGGIFGKKEEAPVEKTPETDNL